MNYDNEKEESRKLQIASAKAVSVESRKAIAAGYRDIATRYNVSYTLTNRQSQTSESIRRTVSVPTKCVASSHVKLYKAESPAR